VIGNVVFMPDHFTDYGRILILSDVVHGIPRNSLTPSHDQETGRRMQS